MKRNIRNLFKEDDELKTLPVNHRDEFLDKLNSQPKKKKGLGAWLKIVATVLLALTAGFSILNKTTETEEISPFIAQIEAVEAEYLANIEAEWKSFIAITDDEILVERFKRKLDDLDKDYQDISMQFKDDTNNILVIESLVENLQNRLQILKDIQAHIKILNQNNEGYEKSI